MSTEEQATTSGSKPAPIIRVQELMTEIPEVISQPKGKSSRTSKKTPRTERTVMFEKTETPKPPEEDKFIREKLDQDGSLHPLVAQAINEHAAGLGMTKCGEEAPANPSRLPDPWQILGIGIGVALIAYGIYRILPYLSNAAEEYSSEFIEELGTLNQ